jgi:hypothetical protein
VPDHPLRIELGALPARLKQPYALATDSAGSLYILDDRRLLRVRF